MNVSNLEKIKNNQYVKELVKCFVNNGVTSVTTDTERYPDTIDGEIYLQIQMDVSAFEKLVNEQLPWYDVNDGANNIFVVWFGDTYPDELVGVMEV